MCTDDVNNKNQENQLKNSRLAQMIEFFTSPNLEKLVTEKLKSDK